MVWSEQVWRSTKKYWIYIILFLSGLVAAAILNRFVWCNFVAVRNVNQCTLLGQSAWEWIKLLIGPIIVAITGAFLNQFFKFRDDQRKNQENKIAANQLDQERAVEKDRLNQDTLIDYFNQMTQLLLSADWPNLGEKTKNTSASLPIVALAKARTFAVLNELDSRRKGSLINFLFETKALKSISLRRSNLYKASLHKAKLYWVDLHKADLSEADLSGADLYKANLYRANLGRANLYKANLYKTKLIKADLDGANLVDSKGITVKQIQQAENWDKAIFSKDFRQELGLSPDPSPNQPQEELE